MEVNMTEDKTDISSSMSQSRIFVDDQGLITFINNVKFAVQIILGSAAILGLVGNSMVIFVILRRKEMRNVSNVPAFSLALADLIFVVLCTPFLAVNFSSWPFGNIWCKVCLYLMFVSLCISIYTIVIMAFNRYLAIVHPIASIPYITMGNVVKVFIVLWVVCFLGHIPVLFYFEATIVPLPFPRLMCSSLVLQDLSQIRAFLLISFIVQFALPMTLIGIFYGLLLRCLLRGRLVASQTTPHGDDKQRRAAMMVFILIIVFALCWTPSYAVPFIQFWKGINDAKLALVLNIVGIAFGYVNLCLNPILYSVLSEKFRRAFRNTLRCTTLQHVVTSNSSP